MFLAQQNTDSINTNEDIKKSSPDGEDILLTNAMSTILEPIWYSDVKKIQIKLRSLGVGEQQLYNLVAAFEHTQGRAHMQQLFLEIVRIKMKMNGTKGSALIQEQNLAQLQENMQHLQGQLQGENLLRFMKLSTLSSPQIEEVFADATMFARAKAKSFSALLQYADQRVVKDAVYSSIFPRKMSGDLISKSLDLDPQQTPIQFSALADDVLVKSSGRQQIQIENTEKAFPPDTSDAAVRIPEGTNVRSILPAQQKGLQAESQTLKQLASGLEQQMPPVERAQTRKQSWRPSSSGKKKKFGWGKLAGALATAGVLIAL